MNLIKNPVTEISPSASKASSVSDEWSFMIRILGLGALIFTSLAWQGCATFMNGFVQPIKIESTRPTEIIVDQLSVGVTPKVVELSRRQEHVIQLKPVEGKDTTTVVFERRISAWLYGNLCFSYFGLGGAALDYFSGGMYKMGYSNAEDHALDDAGISLDLHLDPWSTGIWHASIGYYIGAKVFPAGLIAGERVFPQAAFQMVVGKNVWPVDLLLDGYFYSAAQEINSFNVLDIGLRKTFFPRTGALHPYFGGGLNWMTKSSQGNHGFPLGLWSRFGADFRVGERLFVGPYFGYSKYETVLSGINTGGPEGGLIAGMMW
jgi:hypothetical protein